MSVVRNTGPKGLRVLTRAEVSSIAGGATERPGGGGCTDPLPTTKKK